MCSWLISLDLELYCETFRQNAIDGVELSNMNSEILASDLGIGEHPFCASYDMNPFTLRVNYGAM